MKGIEAIREMNRNNLYSFYQGIGRTAGFETGMVSSARYVSNAAMEWPSYILGGGKMSRSSLLQIFNRMKDDTLPFFWMRPMDEDPEFEEFAGEQGIRKVNLWRGMYLKRSAPFLLPPPSPELMFEEVITQRDLKSWLRVLNQEIMTCRELEAKNFFNLLSDPSFRFFRVSNGRKTVSTIMMHKRTTETGIYMVSTSSDERGKGIGSWVTASSIDRFIADGCRNFVLHATPSGFPVYRKLGFEECCEYGIFWMYGKK